MQPGSAQSFLVALAAGMIAGGSMALYPLPAAAIVYSAVITTGSFIGFASTGDATLVGFAMVTLAFYFVVSSTITRHADVFVSEFVGRLELDEKNVLIEDLLEQVQAQANDERIKSERRLAQAQKMEAIGQLTGGIAHDFNNLLAAIQGHAELIALERKVDDALTVPILRSAKRGSELVRGLLSIARKQPLKSQCIDVGAMIGTNGPTALSDARRSYRDQARRPRRLVACLRGLGTPRKCGPEPRTECTRCDAERRIADAEMFKLGPRNV